MSYTSTNVIELVPKDKVDLRKLYGLQTAELLALLQNKILTEREVREIILSR